MFSVANSYTRTHARTRVGLYMCKRALTWEYCAAGYDNQFFLFSVSAIYDHFQLKMIINNRY